MCSICLGHMAFVPDLSAFAHDKPKACYTQD